MEREVDSENKLIDNIYNQSIHQLIKFYGKYTAGRGHGSQLNLTSRLHNEVPLLDANSERPPDNKRPKVNLSSHDFSQNLPKNLPKSISQTPMYQHNLVGCIDVEPLITFEIFPDKPLVFIGSHAGLFTCFEAISSKKYWEIVFENPITNKAVLVKTRQNEDQNENFYVIVAIRSGEIYKISVRNGKIQQNLKTLGGNFVKNAIWQDSKYPGDLFLADYDKYLYRLDLATFQPVKITKLAGVVSEPAEMVNFKDSKDLIFTTMNGKIYKNYQLVGDLQKNVVAKFTTLNNVLYFPTISGEIYKFDVEKEEILGMISVGKSPIVTSLVYLENSKTVLSLDISGQLFQLDENLNLLSTLNFQAISRAKFLNFKKIHDNLLLIQSSDCLFLYDLEEKTHYVIEKTDVEGFFSKAKILPLTDKNSTGFKLLYGSRNDYFTSIVLNF